MRTDCFTLSESEVVIQYPDSMSQEDFEDFCEWLTILKRKVGRTVKSIAPTDKPSRDAGDQP